MSQELSLLSIREAARLLRCRECSAVELASACLKAAEQKDGAIHAYLEIFSDALDDARRADKIFAASDTPFPPLLGIPLAIKDNILIAGKRVSAGSRMLEEYRASYDATAIRRLKNHGAVFLGRTNMDEFAMGSSTEYSAFGPTRNPRDQARVPGGSSGGSAAAVGAGFCLGALGSDTGGSIRQPASFCGVVGMKPTYGRVSRHGLIAMASSLDVIGPLARSVDDAEMLFTAIAGGDDFDATASRAQIHEPDDADQDWKRIHIGIPREYFAKGMDPDTEEVVNGAIRKLESAGARMQEISLPHSSLALPAYYIIVPSEVSANLARFDGIRYGFRDEGGVDLFDVYARTRASGFGPEVKRRIMLGTYALSAGYYDAYYLKAQRVRRLIRDDFSQAFKTVDLIISPTTPGPAFPLGERKTDPLQMYLADIYTVGVNLAGLPALSLPAGTVRRDGQALPVGLQLIAPWDREADLFATGRAVESVL